MTDTLENLNRFCSEQYSDLDEMHKCNAFVRFTDTIKKKNLFVDQDLTGKRLRMSATTRDRDKSFTTSMNMKDKLNPRMVVTFNKGHECNNILINPLVGRTQEELLKDLNQVAGGSCKLPFEEILQLRSEMGGITTEIKFKEDLHPDDI